MPAEGSRGDLTGGPIGRALWSFVLPTLGANMLHSLNGSINSIWIGRFLGEHALAATVNGNMVMFFMFTLVYGFATASAVVIAQCMGARNLDGARRSCGSALGMCFSLGIIIAAAGYINAPNLLKLLRTPDEAFTSALIYLRILFIAMPVTLLGFMAMSVLRGAGDSSTPLKFMLVNVGLDIVLNPLLIRGWGPIPALGIGGSAGATAAAGVISLLVLIILVYRQDLPLRLRGRELAYLRPAPDQIWPLVKKGLPMGMQMNVMSASSLLMVGLVNREGLLTVAAYAAAQQLWAYLQMPAMAVASAVTGMAAQNIGAKRWDRVGGVLAYGMAYLLLFTGALIAMMLLFHGPLLALFLGSDSPAIPVAWHMQLIVSGSFILHGAALIYFAVMRGNGVVAGPLIITVASLFGARLGFYFIAYPYLGADALWWSFSASALTALALAALIYHRGHWRNARLEIPTGKSGRAAAVDGQADRTERCRALGEGLTAPDCASA